MIAYPLARMNFPGAAVAAIGVAATYLVPQPLLFIPMSDIINKLGWAIRSRRSCSLARRPAPVLAWLLMGYFGVDGDSYRRISFGSPCLT